MTTIGMEQTPESKDGSDWDRVSTICRGKPFHSYYLRTLVMPDGRRTPFYAKQQAADVKPTPLYMIPI